MLLINNQEVESLLPMKDCVEVIGLFLGENIVHFVIELYAHTHIHDTTDLSIQNFSWQPIRRMYFAYSASGVISNVEVLR